MLPGMKNMDYESRLKHLGLPTFLYRRQRNDMIETYKILNGTYDTEVVPKLKLASQHNVRKARGHKLKFLKCRHRT